MNTRTRGLFRGYPGVPETHKLLCFAIIATIGSYKITSLEF